MRFGWTWLKQEATAKPIFEDWDGGILMNFVVSKYWKNRTPARSFNSWPNKPSPIKGRMPQKNRWKGATFVFSCFFHSQKKVFPRKVGGASLMLWHFGASSPHRVGYRTGKRTIIPIPSKPWCHLLCEKISFQWDILQTSQATKKCY